MKSFAICRRPAVFSPKTRSLISPNGSRRRNHPRESHPRAAPRTSLRCSCLCGKIRGQPAAAAHRKPCSTWSATRKENLIGHKGAMLRNRHGSAQGVGRSAGQEGLFSAYSSKSRRLARKIRSAFRELDWHFQLEGLSSAQVDQEEGPAGEM